MTRLCTERLVMRPVTRADAPAVLSYATDPEWARYISERVAADCFDEAHARAFVEQALPIEGRPVTSFAIEVEGEVIGSIHLVMSVGDSMAELACLIRRSRWGAGIAGEAARCVLDYAFIDLGLVRVFARADGRNERSIRAMEKLGMQLEARLRRHRVDRTGARCDEVVFGVLRDEWLRRGTG